jgi:branched-chain amino acid aminotransferase
VAEFTASNVFVVKGGTVFTPPLADGPLPGITRRAVLALASAGGLAVGEQSFGPELFDTADEVFATNSLIEIAPVVTWSRERKLTLQLQQAYRALVAQEVAAAETGRG